MGKLASNMLIHALPTLIKAAEAAIIDLEPTFAAFLATEINAAFNALATKLAAQAKTKAA